MENFPYGVYGPCTRRKYPLPGTYQVRMKCTRTGTVGVYKVLFRGGNDNGWNSERKLWIHSRVSADGNDISLEDVGGVDVTAIVIRTI